MCTQQQTQPILRETFYLLDYTRYNPVLHVGTPRTTSNRILSKDFSHLKILCIESAWTSPQKRVYTDSLHRQTACMDTFPLAESLHRQRVCADIPDPPKSAQHLSNLVIFNSTSWVGPLGHSLHFPHSRCLPFSYIIAHFHPGLPDSLVRDVCD